MWRIILHLPFMEDLHDHTHHNFLRLYSDLFNFFLCPCSPPMVLLNFTQALTFYLPKVFPSSYHFCLVGDTWGWSCKQIFHSGLRVLPPSIFQKEASNLNDFFRIKIHFLLDSNGVPHLSNFPCAEDFGHFLHPFCCISEKLSQKVSNRSSCMGNVI